MKYNAEKHHWRSIRLKYYDYSQTGAYFITIITHNRQCLFGEIIGGEMRLDEYRKIAQQCWLDIPKHFPNVQLGEFVIMPNYIHGMIWIIDNIIANKNSININIVEARHAAPLQNSAYQYIIEQFGKPVPSSIPTIIRSFKSATTKQTNQICQIAGDPVWQRNYYEHIILNDEEFNKMRQHLMYNPKNWEMDESYV